MTPLLGLELLLGFGIGLSLGLLGGGGSILTVPALVYLLGQSPQAAVATSLAIVGANSLVGALLHSQQGSLNWKVALIFGGAGMVSAYLAADLSHFFSAAALLVFFALLMLLVAWLMLLRRERRAAAVQFQPNLWLVVAVGAGVGVLTGILGVGGGFLIVPSLVLLVGLPMFQAIGTSLLIIAANSLAGLAGHFQQDMLDLSLVVIFVVAGLAGIFAGTRLARRLPVAQLRRAFAVFVAILAVLILYDNLPRLLV